MTLIAAAQSCAHPADLPRNLDDHLRLMRIAQARGVRVLVFPNCRSPATNPALPPPSPSRRTRPCCNRCASSPSRHG